ncbi:hypothetical protein LCGC14_2929110, partial [marine sediment metagenome]
LEVRIEELEAKLEAANTFQILTGSRESLARDIASLESQAASLSTDVGAVQGALFQARSELGRILAATASIETAVGSFISTKVAGTSMEPGITERDLVFLKLPPFSVVTGDVIVSGNPACPYMHRIVAAVAGGWQTKGDNRSVVDNKWQWPGVCSEQLTLCRKIGTMPSWRNLSVGK